MTSGPSSVFERHRASMMVGFRGVGSLNRGLNVDLNMINPNML